MDRSRCSGDPRCRLVQQASLDSLNSHHACCWQAPTLCMLSGSSIAATSAGEVREAAALLSGCTDGSASYDNATAVLVV